MMRENLGDLRKLADILMILSSLLLPPSFYKINLCTLSKKDAANKFGIKDWISNPVLVKLQEHGSSLYMNIQEKLWLSMKKLRGCLIFTLVAAIGINWNQGEKVVHIVLWAPHNCYRLNIISSVPCLYIYTNQFIVLSLKLKELFLGILQFINK